MHTRTCIPIQIVSSDEELFVLNYKFIYYYCLFLSHIELNYMLNLFLQNA